MLFNVFLITHNDESLVVVNQTLVVSILLKMQR